MRQLHQDRASGELIASLGDLEVRVVLERGRLTWATSSSGHGPLLEFFEHECGVDPRRVSQVIEQARRFHADLGEQLVVQGLATMAQARAGLRAQVGGALAQLGRWATPHLAFLRRDAPGPAPDPGYTFELHEVLAPPGLPPVAPLSTVDAVQAVFGAVPELAWVEGLEDGGPVVHRPDAGPTRCGALHAAVLASQASLVLIRDADALVLGARLPGRRATTWAGLATLEAQGLAREVFAWLSRVGPAPAPRTTGSSLALVGSLGALETAARELLARDGEVAAVALSTCGSAHGLLGREGLPLAAWTRRVSQRCALVQLPAGVAAATARAPVAAVLDDAGWWFGVSLREGSRGCLWVLGQPGLSTGLGFAVVRALAERLAPGRG